MENENVAISYEEMLNELLGKVADLTMQVASKDIIIRKLQANQKPSSESAAIDKTDK